MKSIIGTVVSAKREKTVSVLVERLFQAPVYKKIMKRRKKFHAHDRLGAKEGDRVRLVETRPLSKTKQWLVAEILSTSSSKPVALSEEKPASNRAGKKVTP